MSFIADKQTLEDLNMLGKYKQHSVFSLYNNVSTVGGEKLLTAMFREPLSNPDEINRRSAIFRYFQDMALDFPFSNEQFSVFENYMGIDNGKKLISVAINLAKKKTLSTVVRDERFAIIQTGLSQTIAILNKCDAFLDKFIRINSENPFYNEFQALKQIFADKRLKGLAKENGIDHWPLAKVIKYDLLLKNTLKVQIDTVLKTFYQLDVYISVGNLAKAKGFSYAKALPKESEILSASELSHPAIKGAVANPVSLDQSSNLIFLTGANMAGKSTFMKAFGINVYLAHLGFPVAATEMVFSVKDGIYSSINVPDNLNMGLSHFYAEVLRVKKVAQEVAALKNLVVIFDELFKGTNVKDAYDATLAVTAAFSEYRNCAFIISTHIIETGEVLGSQYDNIQLRYLPTIMKGSVPTYPYKIEEGISNDRHGMTILENEKIFDILNAEEKCGGENTVIELAHQQRNRNGIDEMVKWKTVVWKTK